MKNILLVCITCFVLALAVGVNANRFGHNTYVENRLERGQVDVNCKTTSELSGRISVNGKGVARVEVTITDTRDVIHLLYTNTFGWYRVQLPDCERNYEIIPLHRRYQFEPVKLARFHEAKRIDFVGVPY